MQLSYLVNFHNGSLNSSVDKLNIGPAKLGDSQVPLSSPIFQSGNGWGEISITRPQTYTGGPVSMGVWACPMNLDTTSQFTLQATFVALSGPRSNSQDQFAAVINARTGDNDDLASEKRVGVSLRSRGTTAALNVPFAAVPATSPNLPQSIYDDIFDPVHPAPFTLEMQFNRVTGDGVAALKVKGTSFNLPFKAAQFPAGAGPTITAVGPAVAIASGPGQSASVQVREFRILTDGLGHPHP
jgi:hypothetical protein